MLSLRFAVQDLQLLTEQLEKISKSLHQIIQGLLMCRGLRWSSPFQEYTWSILAMILRIFSSLCPQMRKQGDSFPCTKPEIGR